MFFSSTLLHPQLSSSVAFCSTLVPCPRKYGGEFPFNAQCCELKIHRLKAEGKERNFFREPKQNHSHFVLMLISFYHHLEAGQDRVCPTDWITWYSAKIRRFKSPEKDIETGNFQQSLSWILSLRGARKCFLNAHTSHLVNLPAMPVVHQNDSQTSGTSCKKSFVVTFQAEESTNWVCGLRLPLLIGRE